MKLLDLGGEWSFRKGTENKKLLALVPGCVHTDLLNNNQIDDPYFADNEKAQMWIGESDWTYNRTFQVKKDLLSGDRIELVCEGLDTLATVKINGKIVGKADNAFRTWRFDIKRALSAGSNTIEILFRSTIPFINKLQKRNHMTLTGVDSHRIDGSNQIRKSQCNYGWDWGPMCVTCGIWRNIRIESAVTAKLQDVYIGQDHRQRGSVGVDVQISANRYREETSLLAEVIIEKDGKELSRQALHLVNGGGSKRITVTSPELWWPNGLGSQPLYGVTVILYDAARKELDRWSRKIGLRTLELVQKPDKWGTSFAFAVNGKQFFSKGANWIPADTFVTRITDDWYRYLIKSAADGNMNMLRVWGGGIYEDDVFYDLCDEYGILIWQDFMFACSAYPVDDEPYVANVAEEARDNIVRLRTHPSMALWCGNNEIEQMHENLISKSAEPGKMTWKSYKNVFDELLPGLVKELSPELPYWPSSPHTPGDDRLDYNDPQKGDAHLWSVWHGREPFEWYRTCEHRFNSEFGFQSFPEPSVVNGYTPKDERNISSYIMELHQRSGIGNEVIIGYMLSWFRLPYTFDKTLWLSQILQGMAIKYAVEHWRRKMPQGMGTLYWQLNDCWPVASWSSIDFPGNWKALHYMARDFYAPLLISAVEDPAKGTIELHVSNDNLKSAEGTVRWSVVSVDGTTIDGGSFPAKIGPSSSKKIKTVDLSGVLAKHGERNVLVWLALEIDNKTVSQNFATFTRPKHLLLKQPAISLNPKERTDGSFEITIKSTKPALWVWIDLPEVQADYSDRFFHLIESKAAKIVVKPWKKMTLQQVEKALTVSSLIDTYME
ncbi:MAG: glycoside hydrolase family 2 protein [Spirochaetales bacterium]|jgi:beta-mannosidase|nr:glycoside hydrolase family 2 protein [Spirochaetales bacterium]